MELYCPRCGAYTRAEKVFCLRCGYRLIPLTSYDLTVDDYVYPSDKDNLEALKDTEPLPHLIKHFVLKKYVRSAMESLSRDAVRVGYVSRIGDIIRRCGVILGLEALPETYLAFTDKPIAFTFGSDDNPVLVLGSPLLKILNEEELKAVIAHELAHIKSRHMLYHTLAELIVGGAIFSAKVSGFEILSLPIKLLLLSWHRDSEVSADRASLLAVGDLETVKSMLLKIHKVMGAANQEAVESVTEPFQTHPTLRNRVRELEEFYNTQQYLKARQKILKRLEFSKALTPRCRFCGAEKNPLDLFCPRCGRSQT